MTLWADGQLVDGDFSPFITNTGSYTYPDPVPSAWDTGLHYQIHIKNSEATQEGWSEEFQIFNEIDILNPTTETIWAWTMDSLAVEWDDPFGDSVYVDIYKGGTYLDTFLPWTPNDGNDTSSFAIPSSWGAGDDFQLKIVNNKGSFGFSDEFSIWAIEVIEPDSETVWFPGKENTEVIWGEVPGSIVRLVVCHEGDSIGTYTPQGQWIDTSLGSYTRSDPIPMEWGFGENYQIKIIDNNGNVGWSEEFCVIHLVMEFVSIPHGSFQMGAPEEEHGSGADERPVHTVTFDYSFEIMTTEVTQEMWLLIMGYNPSHFTGNLNRPVELVSWNSCQAFMNAMNAIDPSYIYRLPSESEWEYCCRAGTTTRFYWGEDPDETEIDNYAWWYGNSGSTTHPVADKLPNAWGLYDMSGNVYEWCQDCYHSDYNGAPSDGSAWLVPAGANRVLRCGGYCSGAPRYCRSAHRYSNDPGAASDCLGFRLVRTRDQVLNFL